MKLSVGYALSDSLDGLLRLKNLRHFTWHEADFVASYLFYDVISANSAHLETMSIGFQYETQMAPHALELSIRSTGLFASNVDNSCIQFDALHSIVLRNLSFKLAYDMLHPTFDFGQIRALKLVNCRCVLEYIKAVRLSGTDINLKSLEFDYEEIAPSFAQFNDTKDPGGLAMEVVRLLEAFQGLEQLYIRAMDFLFQSAERTPEAILNHSDTLKRLVYHYHDKLGLGPRQDCPLFWAHHLNHFLDQVSLEALGLDIVPGELVRSS